MIELSFYISPEDQVRLSILLEKMEISEREFLYRALIHYFRLQEEKYNLNQAEKEASE